MKQSRLGKINIRDLIKGVIVAGFMGGLASIYDILQSGVLPTKEQLLKAGLLALGAAIAYLLKNVFTNQEDKFMKRDRPPVPPPKP